MLIMELIQVQLASIGLETTPPIGSEVGRLTGYVLALALAPAFEGGSRAQDTWQVGRGGFWAFS